MTTSLAASTTSPAAAPTGRRGDIQGLRALAVLMVVTYHAGLPLPGGFVGVDVFFVISGFVITAMLMREHASAGSIRFARFYARRFQRLTPALALLVAVVMVLSAVLLSPLGSQQTAAQTGLGAMLLVANAVIAATTGGYFDAPAEGNPLLNTWSLSVEEQFYLAFPALLAIGWFIGRRWVRAHPTAVVGVLVAGVGAASFVLAMIGSSGRAPASLEPFIGFYSPLSRAWEFALGSLVALAGARAAVRSRVASALIGLVGLAMLTASLFLIDGRTPFPGLWTLLPTLGTVLLIVAGTGAVNAVTRGLATRPMVTVGDWSYSIYLWHWPAIVFAAILWPGSEVALVAAAVVSLAPAVASYRWVEQPIRLLRGLTRVQFTGLVLATVMPPTFLAAGLWTFANNGSAIPVVADFRTEMLTESMASERGCDTGLPLSKLPPECTINPDATGPTIWLLGDSNAAQFSDAAAGAGLALGRPVTLAMMNGCPFIDVPLSQSAFNRQGESECRSYVKDTVKQLREEPPGTVVLASSDRVWRNRGFQVKNGGEWLRGGTVEAQRVLERELQRTVEEIQASGHAVILAQTIPHFGNPAARDPQPYAWDPLACSTFDIANGSCNQAMPRTYTDEQQSASIAAITRIGERTAATVLDLRGVACPGVDCLAVRDGVGWYRDNSHLTVGASTTLIPEWVTALSGARPVG